MVEQTEEEYKQSELDRLYKEAEYYAQETHEFTESVLAWLSTKPADKLFVLKILNVNIHAKDQQLLNFFKKKAKDLKYTKLILEKDKKGLNTGLAWFSTDNKESLIEVVKLHNAVS